MSKAMEHAIEWKKALDAKAVTSHKDPKNGLIDAVAGYERKMAWLELTREFLDSPNPFYSMVNQMSFYIPRPMAESVTAQLFAMVCAEEQGLEVSVETFNKNFNLNP